MLLYLNFANSNATGAAKAHAMSIPGIACNSCDVASWFWHSRVNPAITLAITPFPLKMFLKMLLNVSMIASLEYIGLYVNGSGNAGPACGKSDLCSRICRRG